MDLSSAILDVARKKLTQANISFHESSAENVHQVTDHLVDRIVCNSAFWQVDADKTLASARQALKPDGCFVFNLPGGFYDIGVEDSENRQSTPNLRTMMRQIAEDDYGYTFPKLKSVMTWRLNYEVILEKLNHNGFTLDHYEVIAYQQSQAASLEFCTIPIMTERNLPNVDYEIRMKILRQATADYDPNTTFTQKWAYFTVQPK